MPTIISTIFRTALLQAAAVSSGSWCCWQMDFENAPETLFLKIAKGANK
jgi:hypothetical protein